MFINANQITQIILDLDNDSMFVYMHIELSSGKWVLKSFESELELFDYFQRLRYLNNTLTY